MKPTIGRIVHYRLAVEDAIAINDRRHDYLTYRGQSTPGAQPSMGNTVQSGEVVPAIVVRVGDFGVNLQVFLDGNDTLWVTSVDEGEGDGTWSWPAR